VKEILSKTPETHSPWHHVIYQCVLSKLIFKKPIKYQFYDICHRYQDKADHKLITDFDVQSNPEIIC